MVVFCMREVVNAKQARRRRGGGARTRDRGFHTDGVVATDRNQAQRGVLRIKNIISKKQDARRKKQEARSKKQEAKSKKQEE